MSWENGQEIWIPCTSNPGAFSNERLIVIEGTQGQVSGFVDENELKSDGNGGCLVRGIVTGFDGSVIEARITGSFFNTNGLTGIPQEKAIAA